jgi:hypothetical protein
MWTHYKIILSILCYLQGLTLYLQNYKMYIVGDVLPVVVAKQGVITSKMRILWVDIVFCLSHSDYVIVDTLGRLDAPVAQLVPHVVECVVFLDVHHPVGHTVSECVWRYVVGIAAPTVDQVGLDASECSCLGDEIANALGGESVTRP